MIGNHHSEGDGHETDTGTFKGDRVQFVARRVIVKLDTGGDTDSAAIASLCESVMSQVDGGAAMLREPGKSGRMVIEIPEGDSVPTWSNTMSRLDGVLWAEPDTFDQAQVVPNDPEYPSQWSPDVVRAEAAWDVETGASNVVIGIIDSGIAMSAGGALDHEDLNDGSRITLGTDFVDGGTPRDLNMHGTHVVGIAAAPGNTGDGVAGMNWRSPVYICRTLDANGGGSSADFADAVEEITDFAIAAGKKAVINYSAGGGDNNTKRDACEYASTRGMLLVAATGNDNGGSVISPALHSLNFDGVIAVGSTDDDDTVSSFSNVGPEVTVVAPGRNIHSTMPTTMTARMTTLGLSTMYDSINGTSMASPLVAGLAALVWSHKPALTNAEVRDCITDTAVELGPGNFDNTWGFGRVDARAALDCGLVFQPVSKLNAICGLPKTALCGVSRLIVACPTKAPIACPSTRLKKCMSHLICFEPTTRVICPTRLDSGCQVLTALQTGCGVQSTLSCPSAVDACPSTPGGCIDPGILAPGIRLGGIGGGLSPLELRLAALEEQVNAASTDDDDDEEGEEGWFIVDDDGNIREL